MNRILSVIAACLALTTPAAAQDWPAKPLTMVVAFPAGGSDDILARMLAPRLAESLGQPVNVENIGGDAGMAAAAGGAEAAPDRDEVMLSASARPAGRHARFEN